jgi:hypothetical protein
MTDGNGTYVAASLSAPSHKQLFDFSTVYASEDASVAGHSGVDPLVHSGGAESIGTGRADFVRRQRFRFARKHTFEAERSVCILLPGGDTIVVRTQASGVAD